MISRTMMQDAYADLRKGLEAWRIWTALATNDIKMRYRRTFLGPFWLTIQTAIFVTVMGILWSKIMGVDMVKFMPRIACRIVLWNFLSMTIIQSGRIYFSASSMIQMAKLPFSVYLLQHMTTQMINFVHIVPILIVIIILFVSFNILGILGFVLGFFALALFLFWISLALSCLCLRFHDMVHTVSVFMTMAFFLTPIMWPIERLGDHQWFAHINPFYHAITVCKEPLMEGTVPLLSHAVLLGLNAAGLVLGFLVFARSYRRLTYWM